MKKFAFYLDDESLEVKTGDKLNMTVVSCDANSRKYGINNENNADWLNVGPTICSDHGDENYLAADKLEALPMDITATVQEVNSLFGVGEVVVSIDELENV